MAEIIKEGIYTATIADIPDSARTTLMVVRPPEDIQSVLWDRCMRVAVVDSDGGNISDSENMLKPLGSTEEGALFAIDTAPFHKAHDGNDKSSFTPDILKRAASYALKALMLTRGEVDTEALDKLSNDLA